ncbi:MAG TPA: hypothetical protein VKE49_02035, partial [Myxococcaceae bacterium]|nr:hypothetical protein [Myxococcaceae bacterium]
MLSLSSSVWKHSQGAPQRPSILVLQHNRSELARWTEALSPSCDVCAVSDLDDLDDLLHSEAFDAVVAEWEEHLLDRIQASQPGVRLIHCGDSLPEGVIEAARRGVEVSHVDKPEELKAR